MVFQVVQNYTNIIFFIGKLKKNFQTLSIKLCFFFRGLHLKNKISLFKKFKIKQIELIFNNFCVVTSCKCLVDPKYKVLIINKFIYIKINQQSIKNEFFRLFSKTTFGKAV